jgi:protein pelota
VVKESATGSTTSNKIRLNLTIQVERVQFDPDTCVLRLSGRNREETEHVKVRMRRRMVVVVVVMIGW